MAGVLFMVCVPTESYEKELLGASESVENKQENFVKVPIPETIFENVEKEPLKDSEDFLRNVDASDNLGEKKFEIPPNCTMEQILIQLLENLNIENYSWVPLQNEKYVHVIFCVDAESSWKEILRALTKWGIGNRLKSSLGVIPCSMYFKSNEEEQSEGINEDCKLKGKDSKSAWNEFVLSVVRSRLAVAQVVEGVKGDAKLTFDFVMLIILAALIAAFGLIENSVVSIVASMLISPLMGPILAGTFGTVISDRKLQVMGVRNELIGLSLTILVGFLVGLVVGGVDDYYGTDQQWPTPEMTSRGLLRSLWVGVLVALPSGAGVALGILGDNSGSLTGVAISASLLPPAVNAGLLWALAALDGILNRKKSRQVIKLLAPKVYSNHIPSEYALLGCVSLCLTLVNILCIFIAGIIVLKVSMALTVEEPLPLLQKYTVSGYRKKTIVNIKEVAPRSLTDESKHFWHHDIKVARDYNKSLGREDARIFEKQLTEDLAGKDGSESLSGNDNYIAHRLNSIFTMSPDVLRRFSGPRQLSQATWSPSLNAESNRRSSVKDLEMLYASLGGNEPPRISFGGSWKHGVLSPITEGGLERKESPRGVGLHRRNTWSRSNRFTVIPTTSDTASNKSQ